MPWFFSTKGTTWNEEHIKQAYLFTAILISSSPPTFCSVSHVLKKKELHAFKTSRAKKIHVARARKESNLERKVKGQCHSTKTDKWVYVTVGLP